MLDESSDQPAGAGLAAGLAACSCWALRADFFDEWPAQTGEA